MIIMFEGPDAGGKDFVRRAFEKETKYSNTVVTRFMLSQYVFSRYYDRPQWLSKKLREELELDIRKFLLYFKPLIVYCHADTPVLEARIAKRGEKLSDQPNADQIKLFYEQAFEHFKVGKNLLAIDTSLEPPMAETVIRIVNKVKSLEGR